MQTSEDHTQKIEHCRELYLKYGGKQHEAIEREMRALGYKDFHRRNLYRRFERGTCRPGWIETYGWDWLLKEQQQLTAETQRRGEDDGKFKQDVQDDQDNQNLKYPTDHFHPVNILPLRLCASAVKETVENEFDEFKEWLKRVSPEKQWDFKHQVYIYKHLKKLTDGDIKRLMIFMPPRHGKSELVTVRYAAWRLKKDPSMNVILASYNQTLARRFSRKIKRVLVDDFTAETQSRGEEEELLATENTDERGSGDRKTAPSSSAPLRVDPRQNSSPRLCVSVVESPFPFVRQRPKNTEAEWETTMGGGLRAVGVGSGVTGFGANLIIIDDPVKSRAEAESKTFRERLWNWYKDDICTRLEPDGQIVLIQTRWHEDDLAGRLLREAREEGGEQWTVINLPALSESGSSAAVPPDERKGCALPNGFNNTSGGSASSRGTAPDLYLDADGKAEPFRSSDGGAVRDPLDRPPGQALWPERYDEQHLAVHKRRLGSYSFASLYQQRPSPAEGGLFKRHWFKIVSDPPPNLKWKRGYDLGISKTADADYTASLRVAYDAKGDMYIDGGYRRQIDYPEQRRYILGRITAERDTEHGVELSANGSAVVQDLRRERMILGRALRGIKTEGDKVTQALPWIALAEEGRIHLVKGAWNADFIEEAAAFPTGTHDDQIDAVSIAVRMHREQPGKLFTF